MLKEKLGKYTKQIHYGLSIRQTKTQSSGNPLNQKQSGDRKKESSHTHTCFSSKPSPGIYWGTRQKEAGPDEPLGWVSTVILKYLSEETWNYYFSPKLEKTPFSPLRGKRFPICQCGCLFQSKGGTWTLLTSLSTYIYCESLSLQQWSTF